MKTIKTLSLAFVCVYSLTAIIVISSTQFNINNITGHYESALPASIILIAVSIVLILTASSLVKTIKSK